MNALLNPVRKIVSFLNNIALQVSMVMLFGMLVIVTLNVILRYIFDYSIVWTEESSRYLMVWITFLLFPYAQEKGTLVAVDFLILKWRYTRAGVLMAIFLECLALLVLSICIYQSYNFVIRSASTVTMALRLPMWTVTSIMPYSFGLTALISFMWICKLVPCLKNPDRLREEDIARAASTLPEGH